MFTRSSARRFLAFAVIGMTMVGWGILFAHLPVMVVAETLPTPSAISSEGGAPGETGQPAPTPQPALSLPSTTDQEADELHPLSTLAIQAKNYAAQDRLLAALQVFDAARNAGPEAVLAFAAATSPEVRAYIRGEVLQAQESLAAAPSATMVIQPDVIAAGIAGVDGPCAYATVQEAINAAPNGANVRVVGQTVSENIDITGGKIITITGGYDAACTGVVTGTRTTLISATTGSIVDVSGASRVVLASLVISGGSSFGAGVDLLGSSHVTLSNTVVQHNAGASGGGFYIGGGSLVTVTNGSLVYSNTASTGGGAIVYGRLTAIGSTSDFSTNASTTDGGNLYVSGGTVYFDNADIVAGRATGRGGGIFASGQAVITLTNSVFVGESAPCCQSAADGGGIYADNSSIYSLGGNVTILQNQAANNGGGLYLINGSLFKASSGTNVGYDAQAGNGNTAVLGAGMYVQTSTVDFAGRILNNDASNSGGGLYATASVITLTNTTVGGTGVNHPNTIGATGLNGAGMYLINNTQAILTNTVVVSNALTNPNTGYAGGVYVRQGSVLTATNSRIEQHLAPSVFDGRGAGLYLYDATVTLTNTRVQSNTANNLGAGVRLFGTSTLNVLSGSAFINNRALGGVGGAIAATNAPDINISNATFQNNFASSHGGAVYLDAGTLDSTGTWDIRFNSANGNGGAVAVVGTADVDFSAGGSAASSLSNNTAGGDGGALYIANNDSVQLHATSGVGLNLNTNSAVNGGALFANNGAFFDIYGQFSATANQAGGNGGVVYLTGTASIWMDDYFNIKPQLLVNSAAQGGAIFAQNSPRVECDGAEFGSTSSGNTALTGSGGALYLQTSTLIADNCLFRHNRALQGNGGAIAAISSTVRIDVDYPAASMLLGRPSELSASAALPVGPLATACDPSSTLCSGFYSNQAISNTVNNGNGGAIYASATQLTLESATLHRNTAVRGGAVFQEGAGATAWITNTLVYSNTSLMSFGAGIRNSGGAMTITHGTLANNTGGAGFSPGGAQSYVYNTIIWGNSVAAFGALTAATCNIDQGGTAGPATNPLFMASGVGENYRLQEGSPAIDACATGAPRDLVNRSRPVGSFFDMGAYEHFLVKVFLPLIRR